MAVTISMDAFRKRFELLPGQQSLGNGHFAQLFIAVDKFNKTDVVLKFVTHGGDPRLKPTGCLLRRIQKTTHPNLLHYHESLVVASDPTPNGEKGFELFVYEFNRGVDLAEFQKKGMTQPQVVRVIDGILNGLDFLHGRRIGHGNLKPRNVLIQDIGHPNARLTDYGLVKSQNYKDAVHSFPPESLAYLAPEQLDPQLYGRSTVKRNCDFWALGMIVYELFRGKYVFGNPQAPNSDLVGRIKAADLPKDIEQMPPVYAELVKACLVRDPRQRPQKVSTLRKILSGAIVWKDGCEVEPTNPVPQDIYCYNCGTANPPTEVTCYNCGKALTGPAFLKSFKYNNAYAFWTIAFFLMCLLPIGFFYYGLHKTADSTTGDIDIIERAKQVVEFYNDYLAEPEQDNEVLEQIALVVSIAFGVYYLVFGFLWGLFQLLWLWRASNNLTRLGSHHRVYPPVILLIAALVVGLGILGIAVFPFLAIIAIPLSTVIPLLILQEVWRGSNPTFLVEGTNWKSGKGSSLITTWWLLSMIFPLLLLLPLFPTVLDFVIQIEWFYLTIGILVAYIAIYILVIVRVNYRQTTKYMAWARQGGVVGRRPRI
jgi:serine/threonine protein kinase